MRRQGLNVQKQGGTRLQACNPLFVSSRKAQRIASRKRAHPCCFSPRASPPPLQLTLENKIPNSFPHLVEGLTIHWHGFSMRNQSWYDGVGFLNACPVQANHTFTYRFIVDEIPGTYLWHGHVGSVKVDGFAGPLIVRPKPGAPQPVPPVRVDAEYELLLEDWWHQLAAPLTAALNR